MTVDSLLALLLNVAIPSLLAVAGGLLAAKSLANGNRLEKNLWIALFIFLALVAVGLGFIQQVRLTTQQARIELANQNREALLIGENKFTQGQLLSINTILGALVSKQGQSSADRTVLEALIVATAGKSHDTTSYSAVGLKGLSNEELRGKAFALVTSIRKIDQTTEEASNPYLRSSPGNTPQAQREEFFSSYARAHAAEEASWQSIRVQARLVIDELVLRLPAESVPKDQMLLSVIKMAVDQGSLAGARPLADVALYIDTLAQLLPMPILRGQHNLSRKVK